MKKYAMGWMLAVFTVMLAMPAVAQTTINNGQTYSGLSGAGGSEQFFRINVPAGQGRLVIETWGGTGDADLYVRLGANPSTSVNNGSSTGGSNTETITINNPAAGWWHIMIRGWSAYSGASLKATFSASGPANDNFASRTAIASSGGTVSGSNVNATKETGEPNHAGNTGGRSVWWTWTPSVSGSATIRTAGSNFDTTLAVYTGGSVSSLTLVPNGSNDDYNGAQSQVTINVVAGTAYQIAVDGYNGASGSITLQVVPPSSVTIPAAPGGVAATQNLTDRVRVTWNASTGATSYEVWRGTSTSSGSASRIGTVSGTSFDDTGAVAGTTYYYWLKAGNTAGWSGFSAMATGLRPIAISNDQTLGNLSGASGSMTHYRINVPAGQAVFVVRTWGGSGDCDIYVNNGSPATTSSSWRSRNAGNSDTVTINNPASGDWYIALHGSAAYSGMSLQASHAVNTISVAQPPSGAQWQRGTTQTIRWTSTGSFGNVRIQLMDSSGNYTMIADNVANSGSYNWAIPANGVIGSGFRVRVSAVNNWSGIHGFSPGTFSLAGTVPQPPGSVAATQNLTDRVQVTWNASTGATSYEVWRGIPNSTGQATRIGTVTGTSFSDTTAAVNQMYYYWLKAGNSAGWSVFSASAQGRIMPAFNFSISASPASGTVTRPASGTVSASTTVRAWKTSGADTAVSFSIVGLPTGVTANPSSWNWTLGDRNHTVTFTVGTNAPVGTHTIRIRGTGGGLTREATYTLTISVPNSISVSAPPSGAQWQRGTTQTIRWTSTGSFGNVRIQLMDSSGNYTMIADNVANSGSYNWAIPANGVIGSGFRVRVSAVNNWSGIHGFSPGTFSLAGTVPQPPGSVAATQNLTDRVQVTWNASTGATSYEVWRGTSTSSGSASRIGTISGTSFDDTGAVAGTTYYYCLKAGNTAGWSGFSAMATGLRPINLTNGQTLGSRSGASGSITHYRINVPAGQAALVVRTWGGSGDCDIYVKYGSPASTGSHNGRSINVGNSDTVIVDNPASGDWYIMLHGKSTYSGVSLKVTYSSLVSTSFAVPEDTWGQDNPDYCSVDGAINQILCWSPVSGGGSCYAIATMNLRWFRIQRSYSFLPRLRSIYNSSPSGLQNYTAGLVQNLTAVENAIGTLITQIENGTVGAQGVCNLIKSEINSGRPVLVIQRGTSGTSPVGHAVVAISYSETDTIVTFRIADPNYPDSIQMMRYNTTSQAWSYYWNWSNFKIGAISLNTL